MKTVATVCPLDCYDTCGLLVEVEGGRVVDIKGDPNHPFTRGLLCPKARLHLRRLYSPQRLLHPVIKRNNQWHRISWPDALSLIADQLLTIKEKYGTLAVFHYYSFGHQGLLRRLNQRFFNAYGGVTEPEGDLCWGAGVAAQKIDFGALACHHPHDLLNSRAIVLWGRNPAVTNMHLIPFILESKRHGAKVISINPITIEKPELADEHYRLLPGSDGALALGIAGMILQKGEEDPQAFTYIKGGDLFREMVAAYPPQKVAELTGIDPDRLEALATVYANGPVATLLGMGMQRYRNGGQGIRAIDALAAITGNIGVPGGGVNFGHSYHQRLLRDLTGRELAQHHRGLLRPKLGAELPAADDPPIEAVFVTGANPVNQSPEANLVKKAFGRIPFKVVIDLVMTDTAAAADLVLPCTTFLEDTDLIFNSNHSYLGLAPQVIAPLGEARAELAIFTELARLLGLTAFEEHTAEEWIELALQGVVTLKQLKKGYVKNPLAEDIPWRQHRFPTPSGKIEIYSSPAGEMGLDPLPIYHPLEEDKEVSASYPLHLITPHHRGRLHSQFCHLKAPTTPVVDIGPEYARQEEINEGERVAVITPNGKLDCLAHISQRVGPKVAAVSSGEWLSRGGGVNLLTNSRSSEMGGQAAFYDCRCRVVKVG